MIRSLFTSAVAVFLVFGLVGCSDDAASKAGTTTETVKNVPVEIPFTLTKWNNIAIDATLNGSDTVRLMFHTDAGSVVLTEEAVKKCTSLKFDEKNSVETKSWGGSSSARFFNDNKLAIQGFAWDDVKIYEDVHSGRETDGKFGPGLFEGKVLELDFERNVMLAHEQLPEYASEFFRVTIDDPRGSMFLEGSIEHEGRSIGNRFLVHSGYSGAAMLDDQFVADNEFLKTLPVISESEVKDSFGNVLKTKKIVLPSLEFCSVKFTDVPVSIFDGAIGRRKMSVFGGDLLKRFDVILDVESNSIYFRKNALNAVPFFAG